MEYRYGKYAVATSLFRLNVQNQMYNCVHHQKLIYTAEFLAPKEKNSRKNVLISIQKLIKIAKTLLEQLI